MEYPLMLYKAGGSMLEWDGEQFDYVIVNDEDEQQAAEKDGYSVEKPQAKKPKKADA